MQNNSKIKVLHIISDTNIGGAGKLLLNLSECINKNQFEFIFAIPSKSKLKEKLVKKGSVYCFSGNGDRSIEFRSIPSICKIIKTLV